MAYTNYYPASRLFHGSMSSIMGTQLDVLMIGGEKDYLTKVWDELETEVVRLHKMLNRFDDESDVASINREASFHPVSVNEELWGIFQDCSRYYRQTKGYFDITLRDFSKLQFDENDRSIFFLSDALHIDLGGLGKGYALKKFQELLDKYEIRCGLANFGNSSVLAVGSHPCGDYWPVGVTDPYTHKVVDELRLNDTALSVSGNMPSHPKHIVDPHTEQFVEEHRMVSVVAVDPVEAEVLTTALMLVNNAELEQEILQNFEICEKHIYKL